MILKILRMIRLFFTALYHRDYNKLQSIVDRRVLAPIFPQYKRKNVPNFLIMTNNNCNLSCYECTITSAPWKTMVTSFESIKAFIENTNEWIPENYIQLSGGEVTLLPSYRVWKITEEIKKANRKSSIYTNGFNPLKLPFFDHVILDDHGINRCDIQVSVEYLKQSRRYSDWKGHFEVRHSMFHYNLRKAIEGNITEGVHCDNWNTKITLWGDAVYPCCVIPAISAFNGTHDQLQNNLIKKGWNAFNPDLPKTIENWEETLPKEIYELCKFGCWKGGKRVYKRIGARGEDWVK